MPDRYRTAFADEGVSTDELLRFTLTAEASPDAGEDRPALPSNVAGWVPDAFLMTVLDSVDPSQLSGDDRVRLLEARQRLANAADGAMSEAVSAVHDAYDDLYAPDFDDAFRGAVAEVRAALRLTRRGAENELNSAYHLHHRLPAVREAMRAGVVDRRRAFVLSKHTAHLALAQAREVCDRVLPDAHRLTTGQLTERIRKACIELDPSDAVEREKAAVADRTVSTDSEPDGTITLTASNLPAARAQEAVDRINRLARDLKTGGETRTMDQLRADVLLDLLCGTDAPTKGSVHVTVDLATQ